MDELTPARYRRLRILGEFARLGAAFAVAVGLVSFVYELTAGPAWSVLVVVCGVVGVLSVTRLLAYLELLRPRTSRR